MNASLVHDGWLEPLSPALGTGASIERLTRAARGGFVVTAGQQPGLFGGPLYTWWKALSALALADALENSTGLPVAPVFWAATDDSDFTESSTTVVATAEGASLIEMAEPDGIGVALAQVGLPDLEAELDALALAAGSASNSDVLAEVRRAYSKGNTVGGAYVQLLRSILEPMGIAVIDAAHPAVRSAAHPVIARALERSEEIDAALKSRAQDLRSAGHSVQVKIVEGRSLAFAESGGRRERIKIRDGAGIASAAQAGALGPNVLLRPIVERSILPTVAYLGGPAETAYFAQVTAVADALQVPAPVVLPRWSGYAVEPRIDRILERYDLAAEDFRDPHAVETRLAKASLPAGLSQRLAELRSSLEQAIGNLSATKGDEIVPPSVPEGLRRNIAHRLDRLERRYTAGAKRRGSEALRDAAIARGSLFPLGKPQERALNAIPFIARYGDEFIDSVMREVRAHVAKLI